VGRADGEFIAELLQRGVSRRAFMRFCAAITATLALPAAYAPRVAAAVAAAPRLPIVWIRGQGCGGDGEALLRVTNPSIADLLLQFLSIEYFEPLMLPSGADATVGLKSTLTKQRNAYLAIVEGAVPTADEGTWWMVGGRPIGDVIRDVTAGAVGTIAVGSCAFDGGLSAASGGSSGAVGVSQVIAGPLVSLPGCPVNPWNLAATIAHYLTFKELPATDAGGRPLFAYGPLVHNECERRAHFEFGEFVLDWGDEGAQKGWCLYKMGCKGPETFVNCASVGWGGGTSWPVKAGVGCIGCTMPAFWDAMSPFSRRLPSPVPFFPNVTVDQVGQLAVGGIAGVAGLHAVGSYVRARRQGAQRRRLANATATAGPATPPVPGVAAAPTATAVRPGADVPGGGVPVAAAETAPGAAPPESTGTEAAGPMAPPNAGPPDAGPPDAGEQGAARAAASPADDAPAVAGSLMPEPGTAAAEPKAVDALPPEPREGD
jgi:hydrogenase small subunit